MAKRLRYTEELGLSNYDANLLTQERATAEFFEIVAETSENPKSAANWVLGDRQCGTQQGRHFNVRCHVERH